MPPKDFLTLAESLLKTLPCPAGFRSAVSRAYYAAHHYIKAFVETAGVTVNKSADAHADVWQHLADIADPELEQVGNGLAQLRSDRNQADYELTKSQFETKANATDRVSQARELIEAVDQCVADAARYAMVKAAIKKRNKTLRGT